MDIITRITRQRGKMQIVISEQETIVVPLSLFRERPLTEGQPINLEEYDNWLMVRQYRHALDRAVACLAARAHSKHEIEQKLLRVGYRPCTVEMVLYKLEREHLLNDADFARQWVEARSGRKLGRSRIAQELRRKGIDADEAEEALSVIGEDDQLADAIALAEKAAVPVLRHPRLPDRGAREVRRGSAQDVSAHCGDAGAARLPLGHHERGAGAGAAGLIDT